MSEDLVAIAKELAAGEISIADACRVARETTGGSMQTLLNGRHRVLSGDSHVQFEHLQAFLAPLPPSDVRKWAGILLMTHAQLGTADIAGGAPEAEKMSFESARALVERIISVSGGKCPSKATDIAVAMVDAILRHPLCDTYPPLQASLMRARASYAAWSESGANQGRMTQAFDTVLECFDEQQWEYHADPAERKVMVGFFCPLGETRLVCSIRVPGELAVVALDVIRAGKQDEVEVRRRIQRNHPEVIVHHDADRQTVALEGTCTFGHTLSHEDVMNIVVRVNGAAEALLLWKQTP